MSRAALLLFLLTFSGRAQSSAKVCSYQDVLDHLNLTIDNNVYKLTRPVLDHRQVTTVELDIILYAILSVVEKKQMFVPFIWTRMRWRDHRISWDPDNFCGITKVSVPLDIIWKPDLCIFEMFQKDESPMNPYLVVDHDGMVTLDQDMQVVSTCKMDVYKFPFDTQSCNITIGSTVYCDKELKLVPCSNSSRATQFSREVIKTQGEWEFLQLSVSSSNFTMQDVWEILTYTFTMKRRPLLYVINFLLPIFFFLTLDLASFFIADHRGEKLGFKVTVLLAISVLLLILDDILPSMSNKTPLIATYCIVIFALMLLSLLETILVTYLMDRTSQENLRAPDSCEDKRETGASAWKTEVRRICGPCACGRASSPGDSPPSVEVERDAPPGDCGALGLILEQLRELQETLDMRLGSGEAPCGPALLAERINKGFFVFYVAAISVFLLLIFSEWSV